MIKVHLVPILENNYVFVVEEAKTHEALVVDPGEAQPVIDFLDEMKMKPTGVLVTHQHADHTGGVAELKDIYKLSVWGPRVHHHQIPELDTLVGDESHFHWHGENIQVLELPGHTKGHVAYFFENQNLLFSGDVLFGLGCGRLFEGTPEEAFYSLSRIKKLPAATQVFCTHEYTEANLRFCRKYLDLLSSDTISSLKDYGEKLQALRSVNKPSVPLELAAELRANPFLQAQTVDEFRNLRQLRNTFS